MSTSCQIAAKLSDGTFGSIHVHCDGYPEHSLAILEQHYTEQQKIEQLIALGHCVSIAAEIATCDPCRNRSDADWRELQPIHGETLYEVMEMHAEEDYRYAWDGKQWATVGKRFSDSFTAALSGLRLSDG